MTVTLPLHPLTIRNHDSISTTNTDQSTPSMTKSISYSGIHRSSYKQSVQYTPYRAANQPMWSASAHRIADLNQVQISHGLRELEPLESPAMLLHNDLTTYREQSVFQSVFYC